MVTAADPASGSEPSTTVTVEQTPAPEVVANQPETPAPGDETSGQKQEPAVVRVVDGDIDRVEQPTKKTAPSNGSGSGSSNGGNSSSGARNDAITPQPSGGNGGGTPAPPSGASADAFDGVSAGELAGGTGAGSDSGDEITSGDPGATTTP